MERFVAEDSEVLVPAPAHISFPWEDSNNGINLQSPVKNTGLGSISGNEATGNTASVANEPLRERRRWARPNMVHTISSNNGNTSEEKNQYENEEKCISNRHCYRDNLDTQRMIVPCPSSKNKYQHRAFNSESAISQNDSCADENHYTLLELSDRNRSLDDQIHDNITESPVAARIPSPSSVSSITSGKRLEWDSGADVGYHFIQDNNIHIRASLSTVERIALAQGCSAALFERLEPEGTSGPSYPKANTQNSSLTFDSPIAKSTPVYKNVNKINQRIMEEGTIVEPSETVLPGGYIYLHVEEELENEVAPPENLSSENSKNNSGDENKVSDLDTINKKHSNSLTNISCVPEELSNTVPRSQSYLNLLSKEDDCLLKVDGTVPVLQQQCTLAAACSVSSSSVATIVQKPIFPKTSDKFIQTLPLKLSVGVQACENIDTSHVSESGAEVQNHAVNFVDKSDAKQNGQESAVSDNRSQSLQCNYGCEKQSVMSGNICQSFIPQNSNFNLTGMPAEISKIGGLKNCLQSFIQNQISQTQDKELGTLESATSSTQTVGSSCIAGTSCSGAGIQTEEPRDSAGIVGSVNSFEYLPGNMFDTTFKSQDKTSTPLTSSETSSNPLHSDQIISPQSNELCNQEQASSSSSLTKDIEEGVQLLQKLMSDKSYNGRMKKKLIRQVINKLVYSDYPEDFTDKEKLQRIPLSSNVPWIPATPNSRPLKNVGTSSKLDSGNSNERNNRSLPATSVHSSGGRPKGRSVVSVSETRSASSSCTPSGSLSVPGDNEESQAETSEVSSNMTSRNIKRDWKLPTSRSEKDYEKKRIITEKHTAMTPPLLRLCKTEHEKQLQWIRFEIDHLTHLKQLLEKQEEATRTLSNLTTHEHKFHKIEVDKSTLHNSNISRFKMKVAGSRNNCKEYDMMKTNDSNFGYTSSNSKSTFNADCRQISSSEFSVQSPFEESPIPRVLKNEKFMKTCNKYDFSTQTPTLDSYVLHSIHGTSSDSKRLMMHSYSNNEAGRLNVCVQTSPKTVKKQSQPCRNVFAYARAASENASGSFESAVKCCCDCKKVLEEIVNVHTENSKKIGEDIYVRCKCNTANAKSNPCEIKDQECPLIVSHNSSVSDINESKSSSIGYRPQKRNIATETVVNKSIQTSSSLHEVPIVKSVWNENNESEKRRRRSLENKVNKYCPCCGLPEMKSQTVEKQQNHSDLNKCSLNAERLYEGRKGKSTLVSNASIQTNVKEPLAYLLTFEPTCQENTKLQKRDSLPEIKLLVPISQSTLENKIKKKVPAMDMFKENQCPPRETQVFHHKLSGGDQLVLTDRIKEKHKLTLQEYLRANRPDYIQHADKRTQCLAELALLRDLRKQKRLELMTITEKQENEIREDVRSERIICSGGVSSGKPKLTSRMMREQSRRKYKKSREIQDKLVEKKRKEDFRTNRLMAELFTKKLQKKVLQGVVNHSNTASVVSSVL